MAVDPSLPVVGAIRAAIAAAGGVIAFSRFHEIALYGPDGFYARGRAGRRRGDFLTSPEVGPLFGAVIARYLDHQWRALGEPDPFTVVDAGAGPGTLARAVAAARADSAAAMRYVAVERSAAQRADHPEWVESADRLPDGPLEGVVVANELLDNIPFRLAVFDGSWREAYVADGGDRFVEVLSAPLDPLPAHLPTRPAHGARAPLVDGAAAWVDDALRSLRAGTVVVLDYTRPLTAELAARPWRDWLRTYRGHERGGHYLAAPGSQDITVDVPLDQLPPPDTVRTQAQFLRRFGIDDLVEEGRRGWAAGAAAGGLDALRLRSRLVEAEALLDPAGLGGFTVVEYRAPAEPRPDVSHQ